MAKAPKPGGAGSSAAAERARLRAKVVQVTVGDESYSVPIFDLPLWVTAEFMAGMSNKTPKEVVLHADYESGVKVLWWVGRRLAGIRSSLRTLDADFEVAVGKMLDAGETVGLAWPDDDEDAEPDPSL